MRVNKSFTNRIEIDKGLLILKISKNSCCHLKIKISKMNIIDSLQKLIVSNCQLKEIKVVICRKKLKNLIDLRYLSLRFQVLLGIKVRE